MEPDQKPGDGTGDAQQRPQVPNSDMQAEDAGTAESGNERAGADAGRGTPAEKATKQVDKTDAESGRS